MHDAMGNTLVGSANWRSKCWHKWPRDLEISVTANASVSLTLY